MTGDWRRLALAALAATAVAGACVTHVEAQTTQAPAQAPAKAAAQKAPTKAGDAEHAEDGEDADTKKPAKKKRQDPAEAQRAVDAALALLEAGKSDQAAQALTTVLGGGNLPPAIMAKALLYRGIAYRQQKKPAQAIADLTSALWLKGGLNEADRGDALKQRSSAYQEAGLAEASGPIAPAVPNGARAPRTASASDSVAAPEQPAPLPAQSSGGWLNPFAGLFGGSPPAPPAQAPPQTTASIEASRPAPAPVPAATKSSGWSSNTEVRGGASSEPAPATVTAAKPEGRFRIQIGMMRTQVEAQALAVRVKREYAAMMAAREPEIDETAVGNMGSFYRVRVGPFASAQEGQAACTKLKGTGIDCLVVAQ
jgi:tetratricopeptide (TPR) repeat protein